MGHGQAAAQLRGGLMAAVTIWLVLPFLLSAAATWLARGYALGKSLLDHPGERRSHAVATPRGGGISIVACVLLGMAWIAVAHPAHRVSMAGLATGLMLVGGIGWLDDHRPLSPLLRLFIQALAALILGWVLYQATGAIQYAALAFVAVMVLVNVWNFMDGINGLAASQAAIAAFGYAWLLGAGPWLWLAAVLFASICGFLPFNFPRARIFLGDVGSGALGYMLAVLLAAAFSLSPAPGPALFLLLLPLSAFLIDAGFTLCMRILAGERWWEPHVQHLYQGWVRKVGGHAGVTLAYAVFSLLAVILMLAAVGWTAFWIVAGAITWYAAGILVWARLRKDVQLSKEAGQ
ncbi:lipopolysaccharide biosynthesis protein [Pseudoxanthomonas gei]|uniref:Lipopolysaccharide biosynthesis protein n=2 Tax=Pseudoxanthomonas gei TaxID=1383030 RepID=A0ABX0AA75_9GAMM|nr:lipopolysaccharide biosynthesis protein [Pseudoxanthomonas gei]